MLSQLPKKKNSVGGKGVTLICGLLLLTLQYTANVAAAEKKIDLQWLGHSAFKIVSLTGKVIVIDPFLSNNPKTPAEYKNIYALGKIDTILITHGHADHVGDTVALAKKYKAPVYAPPGLSDSFIALGVLPKKLLPKFNKGGVVTPWGNDIKITMTHAEHSSEYKWKNRRTGAIELHVGGEPVGYIIEFENGFKIYHMGDTGLFGDMRLIGDYYNPDLILIPIGSNYTMGPIDAAYATTELLKPHFAIPIHYGTFPVLKGTPAQYRHALGDS
ncbi:MAG: metal-dependent hydrolase, partial [Thiohalomonadales bacterium]